MKSITLLNDSNADKLEHIASLAKRHSRIYYYFLREDGNAVYLRVEQKKSPAENYLNQKDLISRTKKTFQKFTQKKIHVHAVEYKPAPPEIVDGQWTKSWMNRFKIRLKDLSAELGIPKADLSGMLNGHKPIGNRTKAAIFYFMMTKLYDWKIQHMVRVGAKSFQNFVETEDKDFQKALDEYCDLFKLDFDASFFDEDYDNGTIRDINQFDSGLDYRGAAH